mgnify:CR=1 FL=1
MLVSDSTSFALTGVALISIRRGAGTSAKTSPTVEFGSITPRHRWSVGEKNRLIEARMLLGLSFFLVARTYDVAPNLFYRRESR